MSHIYSPLLPLSISSSSPSQCVPPDCPPPTTQTLPQSPSPHSASTGNSSRTAPAKSGPRTSSAYSSKARRPPLAPSRPNPCSPGLREYWESPWATYSRGRSRWRNQFLVDYLHKTGVDRSKKQVASHIQVLRNMWKGEPGISTRPSPLSPLSPFL